MGSGSSKDPAKRKPLKDDKRYLLKEIKDHEGGINCLAVTPDGGMLCSASEDHTARIYSLDNDEMPCIAVLRGTESYINWLVCNSTHVFTCSADSCIRKWKLDGTLVRAMKGHTGAVNRIILVENLLISSSYDRSARVWDVDTGECLRVFQDHKRGVYPLRYVPSTSESEESAEASRDLGDLEHNQDLLVTGSADFTAKCWAMAGQEPLTTFKGHTGAVLCLEVAGGSLYTGSVDNTCRSWELQTGKPLHKFEGHQASILHLMVVNRILFSGSSDHTVKCWVAEFGECTRTYRGHTHSIVCMTIANGLLLTGSGDCMVHAYDVKGGKALRIFKGHQGAVNGVVYHKQRIISASHDGSIRVWDARDICKPEEVVDNANSRGTSSVPSHGDSRSMISI